VWSQAEFVNFFGTTAVQSLVEIEIQVVHRPEQSLCGKNYSSIPIFADQHLSVVGGRFRFHGSTCPETSSTKSGQGRPNGFGLG
jgi:hypothetical protein